jgi:peptide-methionine (S)-S-oxide reductase
MTNEKAIFAAGCFWRVQDAFAKVKGVKKTIAGYTGGHTRNPTYEDVCDDETGHAEAVHIEYDPSEVTYETLLSVFWGIHDPTTKDRQGPDIGRQYRSAVYYHNSAQKNAALSSLEGEQKNREKRIVTEILQAGPFYHAEEYHQNYHAKTRTPGCFKGLSHMNHLNKRLM